MTDRNLFSPGVVLGSPEDRPATATTTPPTAASTHEVTLYIVFGVVLIVFIVIIIVVIKVMKHKNSSPAYTLTSTGKIDDMRFSSVTLDTCFLGHRNKLVYGRKKASTFHAVTQKINGRLNVCKQWKLKSHI